MSYTFGIEYETLIVLPPHLKEQLNPAQADKFQIISEFLKGRGIPASDVDKQDTWYVDADLTVYHRTTGTYKDLFKPKVVLKDGDVTNGIEIISPPFTCKQGMEAIDQFATAIEPISFHNTSTSTHIHYSFPGLDFRDNIAAVCKIYLTWWYFEPIIMKLVPCWRRRDNIYCKPIRQCVETKFSDLHENERAPMIQALFSNDMSFIMSMLFEKGLPTADEVIAFFQYSWIPPGADLTDPFVNELSRTRMTAINFFNIIKGKDDYTAPTGTIEVRIKHGSTDATEIQKYIQFFATFIRRALTQNVDAFLDRNYENTNFSYREVLINVDQDPMIHFNILTQFMENPTLMSYFAPRLPALSKDTDVDLFTAPQSGGKLFSRRRKSKLIASDETIRYKNKVRRVHVGPRGGKYIKVQGVMQSLTKLGL